MKQHFELKLLFQANRDVWIVKRRGYVVVDLGFKQPDFIIDVLFFGEHDDRFAEIFAQVFQIFKRSSGNFIFKIPNDADRIAFQQIFFQIVYRSRIADEPSVFVACVVDSREQGQIFRQCDYVFIHSKFLLAFIQYPLFKVMPQKNGVVSEFTRHLQSLYLIKTLTLQPRHNIDNVLVRGRPQRVSSANSTIEGTHIL